MMMLKTPHVMSDIVTALFSKTIFKSCFVRDSSVSSSSCDAMDTFLQMCKKIQRPEHTSLFRPETVTCVYGRPGIGKTHFVARELPNHILLDHMVLKGKQSTIDFFDRLKYTSSAVVIDNWESVSDLVGIREIMGPVSRGPLVVIAHTPVDLTRDTIMYPMPVMTPEEIVLLAPPNHPHAKRLADKCRGDVRIFIQSLTHDSDESDAFKTPREIVEDLVTCRSPIIYLTKTVHEHGYVWGMIQENYLDAKAITIDTCADIADSHSLADMYDTKIYADGAWDTLMPYFLESACVRPCMLMKNSLNPVRMRAGSMWTKFQNMCMRRKKIRETRMTHEALQTIRCYVEHGLFHMLDEYKLDASDVDVLNHIVVCQKLKPRTVEQAKKHVRSGSGRGGE